VRSFVLRQGRLTGGQKRALAESWRRYGLDYVSQPLDLDRVFGRSSIKVLDIGAGMGDTTLALAARHPESDFLAVEVHLPGVGGLLRGADAAGLGNIRVIRHDVVEVLRWQIRPASLDEIYIFFPDPWPKRRHHKRRLLNREFAAILAARLRQNGRLFLATDWPDLAAHMLRVCDSEPELFNLAGRGNYSPKPAWRPLTRFESRGRRQGQPIRDLVYAPAPRPVSRLAND